MTRHRAVFSLFTSRASSSTQTSTGRLWLPLELRACAYLPACLPACLPAFSACTSPPRCHSEKLMHQRDSGRQVSLLNSDESHPPRAGREKQRQAPEHATHWDEMVSSSVQWRLCSLCSISMKTMWLGSNEDGQVQCLFSQRGWSGDIFLINVNECLEEIERI